jgi:hypothetical protein
MGFLFLHTDLLLIKPCSGKPDPKGIALNNILFQLFLKFPFSVVPKTNFIVAAFFI